MDYIILGLLMLKRHTVYEIRGIIKENFKEICSDSMGSIQAAIKKLLAAQMVTYSEYVEKSVNKKRYSITDKGREAFSRWVQTPAVLSNGKNMEVGKLLFMGLAPEEKRLPLVNEMIAMLEEELLYYLGVQASAGYSDDNEQEWSAQKEQALAYWEKDYEYREGIQIATQNLDMRENANTIGRYQLFALEYGIASMKFSIEWLKNLKTKIGGNTL